MAHIPRIRSTSPTRLGLTVAALVLGLGLALFAAFSGEPAAAPEPEQAIDVRQANDTPPLLMEALETPAAPADDGVPGDAAADDSDDEAPEDDESSSVTGLPGDPASSGAAANVAPSSGAGAVPSGMRLQLPRFGVDSNVQYMGFDRGTGQMEIPHDAHTVAWYSFSAAPGQPGNAVFAAHVTWRGGQGAFFNLDDLQQGDEVTVQADGRTLRYRVVESYSVRPEQADMNRIIGQRSGPETITLITCGGEYDSAARAYDERVIVRAERVGGGSGA